mgnify:CR=1 FL=1
MLYQIRRPLKDTERRELNSFSDLVAHLLFHRGIIENQSARKFIAPDYETIHDPFLLKDSEKSARRIIQAIKNNERISIFADYDADGIPGAAAFNDFFRRIGFANYSIYIPHRHDEGFGLNIEAVEQLAGQGVKLLITIDCGITDIVPAARAFELGLDLIITDHHEPPSVLPRAFAIVDHKQSDCAYPDKNLCGSAVAFKLIQAILKIDRLGLGEGREKWLLDLVGIATLSDMVPLVGENRILAYYGLTVVRQSPRKGLMELFRMLKMNQRQITEDDIAFMITPRINAASRMGLPMDAFRLLAAEDETEARISAEHLDKINNERKGVVASLVKEVKKLVQERHGSVLPDVIVLGNPIWRPSLLGLAANSCAEEFDRPVFLWGRDGDNAIKGSCRSEGKTNVVELMRAVPENSFSQFGGHHHSGGFAVSNEEIHFLEERLNEGALSIKANQSLVGKEEMENGEIDSERPVNIVDAQLTIDDLVPDLFDEIGKLAPFGIGNPKPLFLFKGVIPKTVRIFGKGQDHISLVFQKKDGSQITAISFFGASQPWAKGLQANQKIDLIASLEKSYFGGRKELRLRVEGVDL